MTSCGRLPRPLLSLPLSFLSSRNTSLEWGRIPGSARGYLLLSGSRVSNKKTNNFHFNVKGLWSEKEIVTQNVTWRTFSSLELWQSLPRLALILLRMSTMSLSCSHDCFWQYVCIRVDKGSKILVPWIVFIIFCKPKRMITLHIVLNHDLPRKYSNALYNEHFNS